MIETKMPKDLRSYKTKFGPLTFKQLICATISIVFDFAAYMLVLRPLKVDITESPGTYALIFLVTANVIIMAFAFDVYGVPMDKYVLNTVIPCLMGNDTALKAQKIQKAQDQNKKKKISRKELAKKKAEHPGLKVFD